MQPQIDDIKKFGNCVLAKVNGIETSAVRAGLASMLIQIAKNGGGSCVVRLENPDGTIRDLVLWLEDEPVIHNRDDMCEWWDSLFAPATLQRKQADWKSNKRSNICRVIETAFDGDEIAFKYRDVGVHVDGKDKPVPGVQFGPMRAMRAAIARLPGLGAIFGEMVAAAEQPQPERRLAGPIPQDDDDAAVAPMPEAPVVAAGAPAQAPEPEEPAEPAQSLEPARPDDDDDYSVISAAAAQVPKKKKNKSRSRASPAAQARAAADKPKADTKKNKSGAKPAATFSSNPKLLAAVADILDSNPTVRQVVGHAIDKMLMVEERRCADLHQIAQILAH